MRGTVSAKSLFLRTRQLPSTQHWVLNSHLCASRQIPKRLKGSCGHAKAWFSTSIHRSLPQEPLLSSFAPSDHLHEDVKIQAESIEMRPREGGAYKEISKRWLRDNCACSQCRNQDTAQRQINVLKGGIDCNISQAKTLEQDRAVEITFADGHRCTYPYSFLNNKLAKDVLNLERTGIHAPTPRDESIAAKPPVVQYEDVQTGGVGELLRQIRELGFCFIDGTPPTPEATQATLEAIGPIRNTHYGGFYDFTSDLSSKDTAYTSEFLEPHTDNTYFTEPAGLQALHLLSHTNGSGGESSLVDGFGAAMQLLQQDMGAYKTLSTIPVHGHASGNDGISIQPAHPMPVLSHHPQLGSLMQVRWNNADRAGLECDLERMDEWYDAAAKFDTILSNPQSQYWFQLVPGRLLIFDNWRVLHGRSEFTGKRRMAGGYINRDDFISKYRTTNMSEEDVRASTVTG